MDMFRTPAVGILLISGVTAGILAYTISRRSAERKRMRIGGPQVIMERAKEIGDTEVARASREYFEEHVKPEVKPVLLDLLKDVEEYVNHYFQRAEKAVKSM